MCAGIRTTMGWLFSVLAFGVSSLPMSAAFAGDVVDSKAIIDALKPREAPMTRGLRNLKVAPSADAAAATPAEAAAATPASTATPTPIAAPATASTAPTAPVAAVKPMADAAASSSAASPAATAAPATSANTAAPSAPPAQDPAPSVSLTINFDFNSSKLSASSAAQLEQLAVALKSDALQSLSFRVEGHTDAKGARAYNLQLSQARAESVREYLVAQGVRGERLRSHGFGDSEPANRSDPYAAENRRVRVVTLLP